MFTRHAGTAWISRKPQYYHPRSSFVISPSSTPHDSVILILGHNSFPPLSTLHSSLLSLHYHGTYGPLSTLVIGRIPLLLLIKQARCQRLMCFSPINSLFQKHRQVSKFFCGSPDLHSVTQPLSPRLSFSPLSIPQPLPLNVTLPPPLLLPPLSPLLLLPLLPAPLSLAGRRRHHSLGPSSSSPPANRTSATLTRSSRSEPRGRRKRARGELFFSLARTRLS